MTSIWLTLPIVIPLFTAIVIFVSRFHPRFVNGVSVISAILVLLNSLFLFSAIYHDGPYAVMFGHWAAPFGIAFAADLLSVLMVVVTAVIGLCMVLYAMADLTNKPSYVQYHTLFHLLLAGVYGAFLTADIFNLYVWFEVMLISSFGLMVLDASKVQIDGAIKYVVLNLISTLVFLLAIALLYGATGTLNFADLHIKVALIDGHISSMLAGIFLFSFAIKSALFPVFSWLPASYHTLPSAVVALFAALLTKVGVYSLLRVFTLVFPLDSSGWQLVLIWCAGLTMLTGVLGAASHFSIKRILSFHIISQIGYMIMGLAIFTPLAIAGTIFYIIHHIIVKANLFLIGGLVERYSHTDQIKKIGGFYQCMPYLAFLFIIPAFSLAGFPPLSGFWGKFLVIKASLQVEYYWLAGTALLVGLLTIFSMTKIWSEVFWKSAPQDVSFEKLKRSTHCLYLVPICVLTLLSLVIGLVAEPLFLIAMQASEQLFQPREYIQAVLGGRS